MPNIDAAIIGTTFFGIIGAGRIGLTFVIEDHLRGRNALAFCISSDVVYAAFRKVIVVGVAALSVGITDEFKGVVRVCFSNLDEVVHLGFFRSKGLVFVKSEVNAFEVVVVRRSLGRSRSINRGRGRSRCVNRSCRFRSFFLRTAAKTIGNTGDEALVRNIGIVI